MCLGSQWDVIYTDFLKPFDSVDHALLFSRIQELDFPANLIFTIQDYLTNRPNVVQYNVYSSLLFISSSGIPQGSVLRAPLFNLFINGVTTRLSTVNYCT